MEESTRLKGRLTDFCIDELPRTLTNQKRSGSQFIKADSFVTLTTLEWGEGARNGDLALNANSGSLRPNPTLVRLKKHTVSAFLLCSVKKRSIVTLGRVVVMKRKLKITAVPVKPFTARQF